MPSFLIDDCMRTQLRHLVNCRQRNIITWQWNVLFAVWRLRDSENNNYPSSMTGS